MSDKISSELTGATLSHSSSPKARPQPRIYVTRTSIPCISGTSSVLPNASTKPLAAVNALQTLCKNVISNPQQQEQLDESIQAIVGREVTMQQTEESLLVTSNLVKEMDTILAQLTDQLSYTSRCLSSISYARLTPGIDAQFFTDKYFSNSLPVSRVTSRNASVVNTPTLQSPLRSRHESITSPITHSTSSTTTQPNSNATRKHAASMSLPSTPAQNSLLNGAEHQMHTNQEEKLHLPTSKQAASTTRAASISFSSPLSQQVGSKSDFHRTSSLPSSIPETSLSSHAEEDDHLSQSDLVQSLSDASK